MNHTKASQPLTLRLRDGSEKTVLNPCLFPTPQEPQSRRKHAGRSRKSAKQKHSPATFPDLPVLRHPRFSLEHAAEFTKLVLNSPEPFIPSAQRLLVMRGVEFQPGDFAKNPLMISHPLLHERNSRVMAWLENHVLPYDLNPEDSFDSVSAQTRGDRSWAEVATGRSKVPLKKSSSKSMVTKGRASRTSSCSKLETSLDFKNIIAHDNIIDKSETSLQESNQASQNKTFEAKTSILPVAKHQVLPAEKSKEGFLATVQSSGYEACSRLGGSGAESRKQPNRSPSKLLSQETFLRDKGVSVESNRLEQETKKQHSCIGRVLKDDKDKIEILNTECWSSPPRAINKRPQKHFAHGQKWKAEGIKRDLDKDWRARD